MSKNILRDVLPPTKRSIRDIPLSSSKQKTPDVTSEIGKFKLVDSIETKKSFNFGGKNVWLAVIATIVVVFVILSTVFAGAEVTIKPKQENVDISANFDAIRVGDEVAINTAIAIPYKIITIDSQGSRSTSNVEVKEVDKKASGDIIVFNEYNSSDLRLVKNTRFETSDGLIYRIQKSVIVPGLKKSGGKTIPGSVTVTVYADAPGEKYNIGLVDFTIPGFKGSDKYNKFYARSKTAMTGGYSGTMKIVNDSELEKMRGEIYSDLESELKEKIYSQVPDNYVLFSDGIFMSFENQPNVDEGDSVKVVEKGILNAVIFNREELGGFVARNVVSGLGEDRVDILNIEDLEFSIENKENIEPWNDTSLKFSLSGNAQFVWLFDEEKMKNDFIGQPKRNVNSILSNYVGIQEAEVAISPFWKMKFPNDVDKIKIKRVLGSNE